MAWDFLATLGVSVTIIGMVVRGYLPLGGALPMMLLYVVYLIVANLIEIRWVTHLARVSFFALLMFSAVLHGGFADAFAILLAAVYGGLETVLGQLVALIIEGHVSIYLGALFFVALVVTRKLGYELASKLIRKVFSIAAPGFALLVFAVTASGGDLRGAFVTAVSILAIATMLLVLSQMVVRPLKKD